MKRKIAVLALIETEVDIPDVAYKSRQMSSEMLKQAKALITKPDETEILNIWSCSEDASLPKESIKRIRQTILDHNKGEL